MAAPALWNRSLKFRSIRNFGSDTKTRYTIAGYKSVFEMGLLTASNALFS